MCNCYRCVQYGEEMKAAEAAYKKLAQHKDSQKTPAEVA